MESDPQDGTTGNASIETVHCNEEACRTATTAVIDAVTAVSGDDPTEIPPLYDVIDPDALDALFPADDERTTDSERRVEFTYDGYRVIVRNGPRASVSVSVEDPGE